MRNQWSDIKGFVFFTLIFLAVLSADVLLVYLYYRHVREFLREQPANLQADAGVVFFGDYDESGTRLGPDSEHRALKAAALYREGSIGHIICVGGYDWRIWRGLPHPMKQYLVSQGVPREAILHDSLSFNTITNWQEACKIIRQEHYDKVVAISAPLHVFRISTMIDSANVLFTAYDYHPKSPREVWQVFKDVHREFASFFLSFALKDSLRNRFVRIYRGISYRLNWS